MLLATIKMLSIQPAQASVMLFVDIFSLRRTGILHTASFSGCTIEKKTTYFVFLVSLIFSVCTFFYFRIYIIYKVSMPSIYPVTIIGSNKGRY